MNWVIFIAVILFSSSGHTLETKSADNIEIQHSVSPGHFHWTVTHRCHQEENEEIETTPGSPPLVVDDPATPGCNNWEINILVSDDVSKGKDSFELPLLDITYGIGDNLQIKYEVPNEFTTGNGSNDSKLGDSNFGLKFQFFGDDETKTQIGTFPQIQFSTVRKKSDDPTRGNVLTIPLLFAKKVGRMRRGDVMITANIGYNFSAKPDAANFASGALGVGAPIFPKAALMAEIATEEGIRSVGDESRSHMTRADLGLIGPCGKYLMLFASVGQSLVSSDGLAHTFILGGVRLLPSF